MGRVKEQLGKQGDTSSSNNFLEDVGLLIGIKENWILQSQAHYKTSGIDSTTGKSTLNKSSLSIQDDQRNFFFFTKE